MRLILCRTDEGVEEAIARILTEKGFEIYEFVKEIKDKDYDFEYMQALADEVEAKSAEMVWGLGYLPAIARVCKVAQIPYIAWVIREAWNTLYSETIEYQTNFIFIGEETMAGAFYRYNPGHIYYMPPGAEISEGKAEPGTIGVCNLNSGYPTYYMKENCSQYLAGYISGLIEVQKRIYGYHFVSNILSAKAKKELSGILSEEKRGNDYRMKPVKILIDDFLCDTITKEERTETEDLLKDMNFTFNGNKTSSVNVNITARKWKKGVPYDMLRTMGAGGFVLTNYQPGLEEIFRIGEELVVYEDKNDMADKVLYYLTHDEERKEISMRGRKRVEEHYRLEQRIDDILYILTK